MIVMMLINILILGFEVNKTEIYVVNTVVADPGVKTLNESSTGK